MYNTIYPTLQKLQFNGSLYIETRNNESLSLTLGYKDLDNYISITEHTLFDIASLSKMYTAVMILQLIETKAINLEDKLTKWFNTITYKNVTIEQLLTHTSGIPEYIGNPSVTVIEEILHTKEPYFPAGCGSFYSNTNYVLLAKIIEDVSKLSYEDCLHKMIVAPLHLTHTTTKPSAEQIAVGRLFDYTNREYIAVTDDPILHKHEGFYGDGGIYSTAKEIAQFLKGFIQGKLVSPELVKSALTPSSLSNNYGYGFVIQDDSFGHSGGEIGYSAHCLYSLPNEKLIILLTNEEISPMYEQQILSFLTFPQNKEKPIAPKHPTIMGINTTDGIEGTYQLTDDYQTCFTVSRIVDHLIITFDDQPATHLFKIEPNLYWIRNTMSFINFHDMVFIDEGIEVPLNKHLITS
ncbi:class A beta-lactamase-related serine hydrolase [Brevibacillus laterosporus]|uniref:Penicillin-binding protein E n=1 Tax=Brevibacillus laterosporus LMG 15441 TaxID=1042163 RepID=A0A075R4N7_BRELA|nr:serine hydrolase domain-containing protein [Brevibacillus laterosporus]AIG26148.1 penicillin-binding protein E [Brevibacillus laterosporus LMG 15441]RJL12514.1 penicillin-binding protein [Brevibacillus laterosporus]TPH07285.1 class A beta-lactamase-related serine hydrolase [Brevibacillus laterosporus]